METSVPLLRSAGLSKTIVVSERAPLTSPPPSDWLAPARESEPMNKMSCLPLIAEGLSWASSVLMLPFRCRQTIATPIVASTIATASAPQPQTSSFLRNDHMESMLAVQGRGRPPEKPNERIACAIRS
jgi:hypothetical protein